MADTTDSLDISGFSLSDFSVPDRSDLGWTPAEHVFVQVTSTEEIGDYVALLPADAEDTVVFELDGDGISVTDILVDIVPENIAESNLNRLLEIFFSTSAEAPPADTGLDRDSMIASLDEAVSNVPAVGDPASLLDQVGLGFGELTVIVDDDGSDTVAI